MNKKCISYFPVKKKKKKENSFLTIATTSLACTEMFTCSRTGTYLIPVKSRIVLVLP